MNLYEVQIVPRQRLRSVRCSSATNAVVLRSAAGRRRTAPRCVEKAPHGFG